MATNLLIVEDSTIIAMLKDPQVVQAVPCLAGSQKQLADLDPGGKLCHLCDVKKGSVKTNALAAARQCILGLRGDRLLSLKKLLNTRQLRLIVRNRTGNKVSYTM